MSKWSLNSRIWFSIGLLCVAYVVSTLVSNKALYESKEQAIKFSKMHKQFEAKSNVAYLRRDVLSYAQAIMLETDDKRRQALIEKLATNIGNLKVEMDRMVSLSEPGVRSAATDYRTAITEFLASVESFSEAVKEGHVEHMRDFEQAFLGKMDNMKQVGLVINDLVDKENERETVNIVTGMEHALVMNILIALSAILASLSLSFVLLRYSSKKMNTVIQGLIEGSSQLNSSANQISAASQQLSQSSTEQAAALEQTAASLEEMNSTISKNSDSAKNTEDVSKKSHRLVLRGKETVQKMLEAMNSISSSTSDMAETIRVIQQIDKKTQVINDIVNKTELLSFNASVEAARAGEHGKGFAVVADEVGNLARMSGAAAEEISALLEESLTKVNALVESTKQSVTAGSNITKECSVIFDEVVESVGDVSNMASEIAMASHEQAKGVSEISKAMNQLDQTTQQNAATSEECASASDHVSDQAKHLNQVVVDLVALVRGGAASMSSGPSDKKVPEVQAQQHSVSDIVHFRGRRHQAPRSESVSKKTVGAPDYNDSGFEEV